MSNTPRNVTRNQLAEFLPNQRVVRAIEQLLKQVNDLLPADIVTINRLIQESYVEAALGTAKAQTALDLLSKISKSLDTLACAPAPQPVVAVGDVSPPSRWPSVSELANAQVKSPVAGSLLVYDATTGVWRNAVLTSGVNISITNADGSITVAASGLAALTADTDGTLAANSDTRVATQKATKTYVDGAVTGLLDFKGSINCSTNPNYPAALKGDSYVVSVAGKIGGAAGAAVDIGDVFVASADNVGGTQAAVGASWFILEHNLAGALLAANNLSDLASAATARTNLGIGNVENKTFAVGTADATHTATTKATPVDADEIPLADSAASFALKNVTWANVKATLKTYFDTIYARLNQAVSFTTIAASGTITANAGSGDCVNYQNGAGTTLGRVFNDAGYLNLQGSGNVNGTRLEHPTHVYQRVNGVDVTDATSAGLQIKKTNGLLSSDGSAGITTTITTASLVGKTITIKDGVVTGFV